MDPIKVNGACDAMLTEMSVRYASVAVGVFDFEKHDPIEHAGEMIKVSRDFSNGFRAAEIYLAVKEGLIESFVGEIKSPLPEAEVRAIAEETFEKQKKKILEGVVDAIAEKLKS